MYTKKKNPRNRGIRKEYFYKNAHRKHMQKKTIIYLKNNE